MTRLKPPSLEHDGRTVRSTTFGDIYYSPDDGLAESRYVFVEGNDLPQRFAEPGRQRPFIIGELGFGTGLNLLAAWQAWEAAGATAPLSYWSCEAFPLSKDDFRCEAQRMARLWPELEAYTERLIELYPEPMPGTVQRSSEDGVSLTLAFGDARAMLARADFNADAWFLDGFAPSANPDMWSEQVMAGVARLSTPGATAATFSVAAKVREAMTAAGLTWQKSQGFGRKKHMLRAVIAHPPTEPSVSPWFAPPRPSIRGTVAVIGAGIAGAHVAHAFEQAEWPVTLFEGKHPAAGASGNPAGLVMPRLDADDNPSAYFYRDAFLYAVNVYGSFGDDVFNPCGGVMAMDDSKAEAVLDHALWPHDQLTLQEGAMKVPSGGVLRPQRAIEALLSGTDLRHAAVRRLAQTADGWCLQHDDGTEDGPFTAIVLAGGADVSLWPSSPIRASLGQIDVFEGPCPDHVITDGAYVAPLGRQLVAGATYAPFKEQKLSPSLESSQSNKRSAEMLLQKPVGNRVESRAALRATTPDRHPIAGPLINDDRAREVYGGLAKGRAGNAPPAPYHQGLYTVTGLGSRGLVTAPILAAHVAAQVTGGVSPLTRPIAEMVHPARFLIRAIKRGRDV